MPFKMHKILYFSRKKDVPTIPKILRHTYFLFGLMIKPKFECGTLFYIFQSANLQSNVMMEIYYKMRTKKEDWDQVSTRFLSQERPWCSGLISCLVPRSQLWSPSPYLSCWWDVKTRTHSHQIVKQRSWLTKLLSIKLYIFPYLPRSNFWFVLKLVLVKK